MVASKFGPSLSRGERPWTQFSSAHMYVMYVRRLYPCLRRWCSLKGRELGRRQVSEALVR
jgi:hypothetical protein